MQLQNLFWRKIKLSTTKQSSFLFTGFHTLVVCRRLRKWLQLFIFKGENNLPTLLRRHALYRSSSMHPKYRIPSVAINSHHLCSSTYHLRKSFLQMKTYFTSFYSHNTEKPFFRLVSTNHSNRHDTSSTKPFESPNAHYKFHVSARVHGNL